MTRSTRGMSRPREATSVATRIRAARARKRERLEVRAAWERRECRDVTLWSRASSKRSRRSAVRLWLQKTMMEGLEMLRGVRRRMWR